MTRTDGPSKAPFTAALFLSPKGRIDRRPFIVGVIVLVAVLALVFVA